jgi:ubiquinone/menaquinone biosynthesis C-methylase UbiE
MQAHYASISKIYDKHRHYADSEITRIIRFAGIREGERILDLGCGTGNVSSQVKKIIKADVIGVDISRPMLEVARTKSLEVICADACRFHLPFRDDCFDKVIGTYVIHHFRNIPSAFSECYRILRNGVLVLFTSSHRQIENQHPIIRRFFPSLVDTDKARFPDIPEVERLLKIAGFTDIKHEETRVRNTPIDEEYLEKVKGKYISTYHLLPQKEFEAGLAGLEAFIKNNRRTELREWRGTLISGRRRA